MSKTDQAVVEDYGWSDQLSYTAIYLADPLMKIVKGLNPKRVLDLGCGNGSITERLAAEDFQVVGCDADERGIEFAQKRIPAARFLVCSAYDDPNSLNEDPFDVVLASEVVEHLFFPRKLISFGASVLKPGGHIVLTTPYHGFLKNLALSICNKWDSHHGALEDGGHIKFWSPSSLGELLEEQGFEVVKFAGVGRVRWLWKSMILVAQKK